MFSPPMHTDSHNAKTHNADKALISLSIYKKKILNKQQVSNYWLVLIPGIFPSAFPHCTHLPPWYLQWC